MGYVPQTPSVSLGIKKLTSNLPEAFKQKSLLKSSKNIKRIKHLRLTLGIGRLDPEQDEAREKRVKEGKAVAVERPSPEDERLIRENGWLMVSEIPKVLQAFADENVSLATLSLNFKFLYIRDNDSYHKALCDDMNTNSGILKTLYDLDVRGQITMSGRCWPGRLANLWLLILIWEPIADYA